MFLTEHIGGLRDDSNITVSISPALTSDSFVNITVGSDSAGSGRLAVRGQDFRIQEVVRLPAGETSVRVIVYSTGRDYTADGEAGVVFGLAYPTDRGCLPYTIGEEDASVIVTDNSIAVPGDCDKNVRFEVDRQYFSMKEGESVTYQIYIAGPRPTRFPILVVWQIKNSRGYRQSLLNSVGNAEVVFTAEDWMLRNGKEVTLTISDPDNSIDGDGRLLVAHHLSYQGGGDPNWQSAQCLQTPEALAMTQMIVTVKDVPQTGNQQCTNCATGGDTGALKRPEPQGNDGDVVPITTTTLPDASQQIIEEQPQDEPPPARKTEPDRDGQPQTQSPAQGLPAPQTVPTPQSEPTDRDSEPVDRNPEPATRQQPQAVTGTDTQRSNEQAEEGGDQDTTLADVQAAVTKYQNGEITLKELTAIIHQYLNT